MNLINDDIGKCIKEFALSEKDVGSPAVQVCILTGDINDLTEHTKKNKKDFSCKRGLLKLVSRRTKLLKYIKKRNESLYKRVISLLGLRK